MGWLLKRESDKGKGKGRGNAGSRKGKAASSKAKRGSAAESHWDPHRTLRGVKYLSIALGIVASVWGWRVSERALKDYIAEHRTDGIAAEQVELADAPDWMHDSIRNELQVLTAKNLLVDPMQPGGLDKTVAALEESPWVSYVERIHRSADRVTLHALYHRPAAVVRSTVEGKTAYHWVDGRGMRLPVTSDTADDLDPALPLIVGVKSRTPMLGELWEGKDIEAGLALVRELSGQPFLRDVRTLDVGVRDARGRVHIFLATDRREPVSWGRLNIHNAADTRGAMRQKLRSARRTGVIWGLPPGHEQSLDPDADRKLIRLASVHNRYHSIDAAGKVVDISGGAAMVLQPFYE